VREISGSWKDLGTNFRPNEIEGEMRVREGIGGGGGEGERERDSVEWTTEFSGRGNEEEQWWRPYQ